MPLENMEWETGVQNSRNRRTVVLLRNGIWNGRRKWNRKITIRHHHHSSAEQYYNTHGASVSNILYSSLKYAPPTSLSYFIAKKNFVLFLQFDEGWREGRGEKHLFYQVFSSRNAFDFLPFFVCSVSVISLHFVLYFSRTEISERWDELWSGSSDGGGKSWGRKSFCWQEFEISDWDPGTLEARAVCSITHEIKRQDAKRRVMGWMDAVGGEWQKYLEIWWRKASHPLTFDLAGGCILGTFMEHRGLHATLVVSNVVPLIHLCWYFSLFNTFQTLLLYLLRFFYD